MSDSGNEIDQPGGIRGRKTRKLSGARLLESLEGRTFFSVGSSIEAQPVTFAATSAGSAAQFFPANGFSPSQIRQAYGFNQISFSTASGSVPGDGQGQTIAIVDAYNDPNIASDLSVFDSQFSIPPANLKVVNQTGGSKLPADSAAWSSEISLDVEWAHSIAPAANILLVEANSESVGDLMSAVDYARHVSGVSVVSMSWGGSEWKGETSYDSYFTTPANHSGVTFVNASGDNGPGTAGWPACSPNVLSVGGTSLQVQDSAGDYGSEAGWRYSGGGVSSIEKAPSWQKNLPASDTTYSSTIYNWHSGTLSTTTSTDRSVPDVSYNASPTTGFAVYDSVSYQGSSGWEVAGGTSAGAPQWAALVAIADQGRALAGKAALDGGTGTLPLLYGKYSDNSDDSTFNDVTTSGPQGAAQDAGYDHVAGLGTPKAVQVVIALGGDPVLVSIPLIRFPGGHVSVALDRSDVFRGLLPNGLPPGYGPPSSDPGSPAPDGSTSESASPTPVSPTVTAVSAVSTSSTVTRSIARPTGSFTGLLSNGTVATPTPARDSKPDTGAAGSARVAIGLSSPSSTPRSASIAIPGERAPSLDSAAIVDFSTAAFEVVQVDQAVTTNIVPMLGNLAAPFFSQLSSLFAHGNPITESDLGLDSLGQTTILGLSPFNHGRSLNPESRMWEVTAVVCLGVALAGYWYSSAAPVEPDGTRRRVRRTRDGWELAPCEER